MSSSSSGKNSGKAADTTAAGKQGGNSEPMGRSLPALGGFSKTAAKLDWNSKPLKAGAKVAILATNGKRAAVGEVVKLSSAEPIMPTSEAKVAPGNVAVGQITVPEECKSEAQGTVFWISAGPILAGNELHTFWSKRDVLHDRKQNVVVAVPCNRLVQL